MIDIGSRPHKQGVWKSKKVALVTAILGAYGDRSSGLDVRKVMLSLYANMRVSPEVYLSHATESIEDGKVTSKRTQEFLQKLTRVC